VGQKYESIIQDVRKTKALLERTTSIMIDEIALIFEEKWELYDFVQWAVRTGYDHFNGASDNVACTWLDHDRSYEYEVRYEFLRVVPEDWRIEAMRVVKGISPLHSSHLVAHGSGSIVHASYKVEDEDLLDNDIFVLRSLGWSIVQACESSYGKFTYMRNHLLPDGLYLKPRVNTRDSAQI